MSPSKAFLIMTVVLLTACATPTALPASPAPRLPEVPSPTVVLPTPAATSAPTPAPSSTVGMFQIGENDNGKTLEVKPGTQLRVVLNSTYWTFQGSSDVQILRPSGEPKVAPDTSVRIPGTGAGTITLDFQALKAGSAKISASRTSCGEALLCPPDKRSFQVTVTVSP